MVIQSGETFRALLKIMCMYSSFQDKQVESHKVYFSQTLNINDQVKKE